jgi:methylthioribose-1-phosphate isomerase
MRETERLLHRARSFLLSDTMFTPIEWLPEGRVRYLDQTRLPREEVWLETDDYVAVGQAIRELQVRGAPLIGISAAYGLALACLRSDADDLRSLREDIRLAAEELRATRPTAVNLAWALDRVLRALDQATTVEEARNIAVRTARAIHEEDVAANHRIGANGAALLPAGAGVMTHCNAGALATGGFGTALGVIRTAWDDGVISHVTATETRPLLQGARLTAWELQQGGIPFTLIPDSAAGLTMRRGTIGAVVVGADRIAANGDTANKIGTYQLAVLAEANDIPFYVAAPTSTIDLSTESGDRIPIEERSSEEVSAIQGRSTAPEGTDVSNPAFDVTPNRYITAIITENGVARAPFTDSLRAICEPGVTAVG